jgi:hypothetical protein
LNFSLSGVKRIWRKAYQLFDQNYYLERYPDVAAAGMAPFFHFTEWGDREGRAPCPLFDPDYYSARYPDSAESGMSAFLHFVLKGEQEHRSPHPLFDPEFYLGVYPDVAKAGGRPFAHFVEFGDKEHRQPHPLFKPAYYVARCPDTAAASASPLRHFVKSGGWRDFKTIVDDPTFDPMIYVPPEGQLSTREEAIWRFVVNWLAESPACAGGRRVSDELRRPAAGFNPQIYAHHHREVLPEGVNPLADFIRKGRPEGPWIHRVIAPDALSEVDGMPTALRTAIHAHFYYPDLIGDFLKKLSTNRTKCDLVLTTDTAEKAAILASASAAFTSGSLSISLVPNSGRDIGPFLTGCLAGLVREYDVIGHLHAKRSLSIDPAVGERWREFLWQHLLGDLYPMIDLALSHFTKDERVGIIFPEEPNLFDWGGNLAFASALASRAEIRVPLSPFFEFPVGTMFWARAQALTPLLQLGLDWSDYPDEPLLPDGTMLHALERLLPFAAAEKGYGFATTHIPGISWASRSFSAKQTLARW